MIDFESVTTSQLLELFEPLIETGRITGGKIYVDGFLVYDGDAADVVAVDTPEYDQYGYSLSVNEFGAVRHASVDAQINEWLASDDPVRVAAAKATAQNFFVNVQRGLDEAGSWQRNSNINKWSFINAWLKKVLAPASEFGNARYYNVETGEPLDFQFFLTNEQRFSGMFKKLPSRVIETGKLPNHMVYTMGVFHLETHPDYESLYLAKGGEYFLNMMDRKLTRMQRQDDDNKAGVLRPGFSPGPD